MPLSNQHRHQQTRLGNLKRISPVCLNLTDLKRADVVFIEGWLPVSVEGMFFKVLFVLSAAQSSYHLYSLCSGCCKAHLSNITTQYRNITGRCVLDKNEH